MNLHRNPPRFIYITGCDGTGKTTQARLLIDQLRCQDIKVRHLWLRFPFFFSLPLLAFAKFRGFSRREVQNGVCHGYWDFRRSVLLRLLFPWTLLIDAFLAAIWKVYLPMGLGWTLVCERFVLDMLVDMAIAFNDTNIFDSSIGNAFFNILPQHALIIFLDSDASIIRTRRVDLHGDRKLSKRLEAFRQLSSFMHLPMVSSHESIASVHQIISKSINVN